VEASSNAGLPAHPPLDPLAQEVGVAVVPGVLLDHVHSSCPPGLVLSYGAIAAERIDEGPRCLRRSFEAGPEPT
jgi:hypothetical protein